MKKDYSLFNGLRGITTDGSIEVIVANVTVGYGGLIILEQSNLHTALDNVNEENPGAYLFSKNSVFEVTEDNIPLTREDLEHCLCPHLIKDRKLVVTRKIPPVEKFEGTEIYVSFPKERYIAKSNYPFYSTIESEPRLPVYYINMPRGMTKKETIEKLVSLNDVKEVVYKRKNK